MKAGRRIEEGMKMEWRYYVDRIRKPFRKQTLYVGCAGLMAIGCCQPSFVSGLTLEEAVTLAQTNDPTTKAEIFAAEARYADGAQAVGGYGPRLNVTANYFESEDRLYPDVAENEAGDRRADFSETEYRISFEQPLVDLEKAALFARGLKGMDIAELLEKKAGEDLVLLVQERFYAALSARERFNIAQSESDALKQQVQHAKDRIALGFGTITDQYDAEARYRISLAAEIANKTEFENGVKALEEIIGITVNSLEDVNRDEQLPPLTGDLETWLAVADENNTDLALRKLQYAETQLDYRAKQSRFLPSLSLFADYLERDADGGLIGYGEERRETDVGIRLNINLLAGGTDTAATVAASKRKFEARERVTATKGSLIRSVSSLWGSINDTASLLDAYEMAVKANEQALDATRASYTEGVKNLLDVLNAQQDYFRTLGQYRTARFDYMVLLARFENVVGSILNGANESENNDAIGS